MSYTNAAPAQPQHYPAPAHPQKSFVTTWLLSLLLGALGVDRFYLGKVGTGLLKLFTFGGLGVWALIDLVIILSGGMTDKRRQPLAGYSKHKMLAWIVSIALIVIGAIGGANSASNATPSTAPTTPVVEQSVRQPIAPEAEPEEALAEEESVVEDKPAEAEATWQEVVSLKGKADKSSAVFELTGGEVRMSYSFKGSETMALGSIYVLTEGTDLMKDGGIPELIVDAPGSDETALHKSAGKYFLDVNAANFDGWTVTIEELR